MSAVASACRTLLRAAGVRVSRRRTGFQHVPGTPHSVAVAVAVPGQPKTVQLFGQWPGHRSGSSVTLYSWYAGRGLARPAPEEAEVG